MSARRRIRMTFVPGGESVTAELLDDEAPATCQLVWDMLPLEHDLQHAQYSGREVFMLLGGASPAPRENQTRLPLPGEVLYWSETDTSVTGGGTALVEICLIYGRGVMLRGAEGTTSPGSLFARIPGDWKYDWAAFAVACGRVRREGTHRLRLERVER